MKNTLFPIFLKTENAKFIIVGGGKVGLEKAETLLKQNPEISIKIVSLEFDEEFSVLKGKFPQIELIHRAFQKEDLDGIDFIITATNISELNNEINAWAKERKILINAADKPDLCDFYLGSIVNKGNLKIAISTNGKSPTLAKRIKEYLMETIPENINDSIDNLNQIRNANKGNFADKVNELNAITEVLVQKKDKKEAKKYKKLVWQISILFIVFFIGFGISTFFSVAEAKQHLQSVPNEFWAMLAVGFFAQLVDGALGLGYGITCATSMMLLGIKLPAISGSIHTAEMFSSGISGFSHYKFGNVNKKLLYWIAIPGVIGAVSGSLLLIYLGNNYQNFAYIIVSAYAMLIGIRLIILAFRKNNIRQKIKNTGFLGFIGGFFDAFGGGGWGPIVTSTLLAKGRQPNYVVGTVSLAEFFVTLAAAITFFTSLGISHWYIILGLILGGTIAAPFAAKLAGKLPRKICLILVAFLVITFSIRMILKVI